MKSAGKRVKKLSAEETNRLIRQKVRKEFGVSERPGKMKKFRCTISFDVQVAVSQRTLKEAMSKDWQKSYYHFMSEQEVADHLAYNYLRWQSQLLDLDGFAHLEKEDFAVLSEECNTD